MDCFEHNRFGHYRRPGEAEMKFQLTTVRAFKGSGQFAVERQAATAAIRRPQEAHLGPALGADKAVARGGSFSMAKLAVLGIDQCQARPEPVLCFVKDQTHTGNWLSRPQQEANSLRLDLGGREFVQISMPPVFVPQF
jgi:hypothetical protein